MPSVDLLTRNTCKSVFCGSTGWTLKSTSKSIAVKISSLKVVLSNVGAGFLFEMVFGCIKAKLRFSKNSCIELGFSLPFPAPSLPLKR